MILLTKYFTLTVNRIIEIAVIAMNTALITIMYLV
jgi:hypothetical protein